MEFGVNIVARCRVEISPHYDLWMRGAKYGVVKSIKNDIAHVQMDHPQVKKLQRIPVGDLKRY